MKPRRIEIGTGLPSDKPDKGKARDRIRAV
jgi:hypothetical protein